MDVADVGDILEPGVNKIGNGIQYIRTLETITRQVDSIYLPFCYIFACSYIQVLPD